MRDGFNGIIPSELVQAIADQKCIAFVGAGFSAQVKRSDGRSLPTWKEFLSELLNWAVGSGVDFWGDPKDLEDMITKGNFLSVAQELEERIGASEISRFMSKMFRDPAVVPSAVHQLIPKIPFRAVLTTNYDALVEGAYTLAGNGQIPNVITQDDLIGRPSPLRGSDFFVFKLHGHLDRPSTIVLGSRSYGDLLYAAPGYRHFLETLFTTHCVLFIGFGGEDPNLDAVLDRLATLFQRTLDRHFILLPSGRLNTTEKRRLVLDRRLEVIEYMTDVRHTQVGAFLSELGRRAAVSTVSVHEHRARHVFISGSTQDSDTLARIASVLRDHDFEPWLATEKMHLGDELRASISEAIDSALCVIVVITERSLRSPWVMYEIEYAAVREAEKKTRVIPVIIGNVDPPAYLRDYMYLRLDEDFKDRDLMRLLQTLMRIRAEVRSDQRT